VRRVKIAIDGCGTLTSVTILGHLFQPDFQEVAEVVAVCDIVPERAQAAAEHWGIKSWHPSLSDMLERSDAEAILIIVPHEVHGEHAIQCLRSGRHIYVQKPLAPSMAEGQAILDLVRSSGLKAVAAPGQSLWPMYDRIREVIEQGGIGHPFWAMPPMMGWGGRLKEFPTDPSWFFSDKGGPLRDHGGYGFQSLVSLLGPALRISTMMGNGSTEREWVGHGPFPVTGPDNTISLLDFGLARFGIMPECWSDTSPSVRFFRILGLEGSIETHPESFNGLDILPIRATVRPLGGTPYDIEVPLESVRFTQGQHPHLGHTHVYGDILHLVECIRENGQPLAGVERGLHFVDAVECAFASHQDGQVKALQPPLFS
jgi:predicted dehydrogenase